MWVMYVSYYIDGLLYFVRVPMYLYRSRNAFCRTFNSSHIPRQGQSVNDSFSASSGEGEFESPG